MIHLLPICGLSNCTVPEALAALTFVLPLFPHLALICLQKPNPSVISPEHPCLVLGHTPNQQYRASIHHEDEHLESRQGQGERGYDRRSPGIPWNSQMSETREAVEQKYWDDGDEVEMCDPAHNVMRFHQVLEFANPPLAPQ